MAARIRSLRNFITPVDEASRDDLVVADVVTVQSLDAATTYAWALVFRPEGSTAAFSGSLTAVSPGSFTVDLPGPYLVRLTVDATLPTENTQYVRLRALTTSLGLKLVAAGERRDETGIIPVDVDPVGWAYNQNYNLLALEAAIGSGGSQDLASVLSFGNSTGGTSIVLTSGDIIRGQQGAGLGGDVVLRGGTPTSGTDDGGNVELRPGAGLGGGTAGYIHIRNPLGTQGVRLTVPSADTLRIDSNAGGGAVLEYDASTGKLTVPGVIDPIALILSDPAAGTSLYLESADGQTAGLAPANRGRIRYNNATLQWEQSINGGAYTAIGSGGGGGGGILEYHQDFPASPGSSVQYRGWVPATAELTAVRVYMQVVNTVGSYTLAVTNEGTGNTCLSAGSFNMNTLVATNVTSVALTAVPADLQFAAQGRWTINLTSGNPGFNGSGIYVELEFAHGTAGLSGQDLSTTLGFGNATGGSDIILSAGDQVVGEQGLSLAGNAFIRGGTATGGIANGGDVILRPGEGAGGGTDGAVIVRRADGAASVRLTATAAQTLSIGTTLPMVFDGATGKLTVPGVIDPTAVVFEQAAPPTTAATEGALFISDGSGGLTANAPYFRGSSNESPVSLFNGTAPPIVYYVDPRLPGRPTLRQYQTIADALAGVTPGSDPVVIQLASTSHVWDGTGLSTLGVTLLLVGIGRATLVFALSTSFVADTALKFQNITFDRISGATAATGSFTVVTAPLTAGDYIETNGYQLVAVAGPRTPGNGDFNGSLLTTTALATEIAAALNDPDNGYEVSAVAVGSTVNVTAVTRGTYGNFAISAVTVPPGGITASGATLTGGVDTDVEVGVPSLEAAACTGQFLIRAVDSPTPTVKMYQFTDSTARLAGFSAIDRLQVSLVTDPAETGGGILQFIDCSVQPIDISYPPGSGSRPLIDMLGGVSYWYWECERTEIFLFGEPTPSLWSDRIGVDALEVQLSNSVINARAGGNTVLMTGGFGAGVRGYGTRIMSGSSLDFGSIIGEAYGFTIVSSSSNVDLPVGPGNPDILTAFDWRYGPVRWRFWNSNGNPSGGWWRAANEDLHLKYREVLVPLVNGVYSDMYDLFDPSHIGIAFAAPVQRRVVRIVGSVLGSPTGGTADAVVFPIDAILTVSIGGTAFLVGGGAQTASYETNPGKYLCQLIVLSAPNQVEGFRIQIQRTAGTGTLEWGAHLRLDQTFGG